MNHLTSLAVFLLIALCSASGGAMAAEPVRSMGPPTEGWATAVVPNAVPAVRSKAARVTTGALPVTKSPMSGATLSTAGYGQHALSGIASYYWQDQMTASGERFNKRAMTAAHKTLPMGTQVRVTHTASGRSVVVRINDRGPFKPGRVIDLSEKAAEDLGMTAQGLVAVKLEVVK